MDLWKSIAGMLEVELTSAEPETALAAVNACGIEIFHMQQVSDLTCCFRIRRRDYRILAKLCEKRGETLHIIRKDGVYWAGKSLLARPILLLGMFFLLAMALYLPSRVFFVRVEGNKTVSTRQILAAAEESGIGFGASRREVRSEKVKNALLSAVPQLQWAGVNTSGCVATISVRERTDTESTQIGNEVTSIVAARDGFILSGTVTQGNALFQVGQTVKAGQVLISGYTDCGICIQATRSEGEIVAQTNRSLDIQTLSEYVQRGGVVDVKRKYSLLVQKKRINLWKDSGIWDSTCDRMYEEYYITLPGGFSLPVAFVQETCVFYETEWTEVDAASLQENLKQAAKGYLTEQMIAGKILKGSEMFRFWQDTCRMEGVYLCSEMIGRVQREKIGE